jgi:hypothetical protein
MSLSVANSYTCDRQPEVHDSEGDQQRESRQQTQTLKFRSCSVDLMSASYLVRMDTRAPETTTLATLTMTILRTHDGRLREEKRLVQDTTGANRVRICSILTSSLSLDCTSNNNVTRRHGFISSTLEPRNPIRAPEAEAKSVTAWNEIGSYINSRMANGRPLYMMHSFAW